MLFCHMFKHTIDEFPRRSESHAISKATRLLEHAVSIVILGPVRLKNVLIRLDNIEAAEPVAKYLGILSGSFPVRRR